MNIMIRRDGTAADGTATWVLLSQIEHARLAGVLAELWRDGFPENDSVRAEILTTIFRHDDGWADWERAPKLDPEQGWPLAFTEMPLDDGLAIWTRSIEIAEGIGPLSASMVAGHFLELLGQSEIAQQHGNRDADAARQWIADYETRRTGWLTAWCAADPSHCEATAQRALDLLKFFDALSLWFCCVSRDAPETVSLSGGDPITLRPRSAEIIEMSPWPLTVGEMTLDARGESVPRANYPDLCITTSRPRRGSKPLAEFMRKMIRAAFG